MVRRCAAGEALVLDAILVWRNSCGGSSCDAGDASGLDAVPARRNSHDDSSCDAGDTSYRPACAPPALFGQGLFAGRFGAGFAGDRHFLRRIRAFPLERKPRGTRLPSTSTASDHIDSGRTQTPPSP